MELSPMRLRQQVKEQGTPGYTERREAAQICWPQLLPEQGGPGLAGGGTTQGIFLCSEAEGGFGPQTAFCLPMTSTAA